MTLIRDLLDLPDRVRKGDFVLKLSEGIANADTTVERYAITPALAHAYGQALSVIGSALSTNRSQAVYLHGSFGSGKSHFMALLGLLLDNHPKAWARSELHPLRANNDWVGARRLLRLPIHMIGADNLEQKIFSTYVEFARREQPTAAPPKLFSDGPLFENAVQLLEKFGEEAFFSQLNAGAGRGDTAGWGELGASSRWTLERFHQVISSSDESERRKLYEALTTTLLSSYAGRDSDFIDLDRGLSELSRHAAHLGYDAVVLLLDELILWLAGRIADLDFVRTEAQKLVKLVEAQHEDRPAPLASFIARQRDIADFVGPEVAGAERRSLWDALEHGSGRFEVITLEDTNLPAIVELRVVRPKDTAAKTLLDQGFRDLQRSLPQPVWGVLLGEHGEEADFRKVYPFSPAVLEAMVALSDALQRERTAIRLLTELLVEHASDLVTGSMVVVGDLFDVIAGGEEPFDRVMKERFERAKALYRDDLLSMIRADQGTAMGARCQRLKDDHPVRLGCSGCAETACRNDNRLAKSLLLAALVPHAAPFRDLSVSRLVRLNHGAVPTPIPGTEVQMAADRLRRWAGQIGQLRVGDGSDPQVSLRLEGVDLAPILDGASEVDNPGNRRRKLQEILFEALGLDTQAGSTVQRTVEWRGTRRTGAVRYGNVREMRDEHLRCPGEAEWHVVIDYPFDDPGLVPDDDARRLEAFVDAQGDVDNPTFVWLPTFFSDQLSRELGRLVIIDHILAGDNARRHLGHLRPEDQARARQDLESLGNNKRAQLRRALDISYGLGRRQEGDGLDDTRAAEEHVVSLQPGLEGRPLLQSTIGRALDELVERLLEHRCPHHPRFEELVTGSKLRKVLEHFEQVVAAPDHRVPLSSAELRLVRGIAEPLTLLTCSETSIQLRDTLLRQIDQRRDQVGKDSPTVDDVRGWISPEGNMCLPDDVADLVVAAYAVWSGREPERMGVPVSLAELGRLPGDAQLIRPDLPSETEWKKAIELAGHLFGIAFPGRALNLRNLHDLDERVSAKAREFAAARKLPEILEDRVRHWCPQDGEPARVITARSGAGLLKVLDDTTAAVRVRRLAAFEPRTSPQALGKGLTASAVALAELQDTATWTLMDQVAALKTRPQWGGEASEITDHLAVLLGGDELVHPLKSGLQTLTDRAAALLRKTREAIGQYSVVTDAYPSLDEALQDVATRAKGSFREPEQEYRVRIEATVTVDEEQDDDGA